MRIVYEIALRWMPQYMFDDKSTLVQVMAWCCQATSHYLSQCWSWSMSPIHMMTSSNGNIFRVTGPLCGEFTGPGEFPTQRPVTRSFDVFFDLRLNKRLSKQPWGWWFETLSWSLWRQCNELALLGHNELNAQSCSVSVKPITLLTEKKNDEKPYIDNISVSYHFNLALRSGI